jgi:hypothetical protein
MVTIVLFRIFLNSQVFCLIIKPFFKSYLSLWELSNYKLDQKHMAMNQKITLNYLSKTIVEMINTL